MENRKPRPEEVIINELSKWLTQLDLHAHPTKVSLDISQKVLPQEDTLNRIFTITVSRHIERIKSDTPVMEAAKTSSMDV